MNSEMQTSYSVSTTKAIRLELARIFAKHQTDAPEELNAVLGYLKRAMLDENALITHITVKYERKDSK